MTQAIFGAAPIQHVNDGNWVLEALDADTLRVRRTGGGFINVSMVQNTNCAGNGGGGTSTMQQKWRFMVRDGDTLDGELCLEGSVMLITIHEGANNVHWFRCWRRTGNHTVCQRLF